MTLFPSRFTRARALAFSLAAFVTMSCAAPPKPVESPPKPIESPPAPILTEELAPPPPVVEPESAPAPMVFPSACADDNAEGICGPPIHFVKDVCNGFAKPDVALMLFAKSSPWTRAYMRLNVDAWYTGSRSARVLLKFDEEVIVLHHPNPAGGIIVNGAGAPFDVMRLDGRCATLSGEEVTLKRPPAPKHPAVPWRELDPRTREALLSDPAIAEASSTYDGGCTGPTPTCAKTGSKLTAAILDFMGRGGKIPVLLTRR
jgi:hypothetical protein